MATEIDIPSRDDLEKLDRAELMEVLENIYFLVKPSPKPFKASLLDKKEKIKAKMIDYILALEKSVSPTKPKTPTPPRAKTPTPPPKPAPKAKVPTPPPKPKAPKPAAKAKVPTPPKPVTPPKSVTSSAEYKQEKTRLGALTQAKLNEMIDKYYIKGTGISKLKKNKTTAVLAILNKKVELGEIKAGVVPAAAPRGRPREVPKEQPKRVPERSPSPGQKSCGEYSSKELDDMKDAALPLIKKFFEGEGIDASGLTRRDRAIVLYCNYHRNKGNKTCTEDQKFVCDEGFACDISTTPGVCRTDRYLPGVKPEEKLDLSEFQFGDRTIYGNKKVIDALKAKLLERMKLATPTEEAAESDTSDSLKVETPTSNGGTKETTIRGSSAAIAALKEQLGKGKISEGKEVVEESDSSTRDALIEFLIKKGLRLKNIQNMTDEELRIQVDEFEHKEDEHEIPPPVAVKVKTPPVSPKPKITIRPATPPAAPAKEKVKAPIKPPPKPLKSSDEKKVKVEPAEQKSRSPKTAQISQVKQILEKLEKGGKIDNLDEIQTAVLKCLGLLS